MGKEVIKGRPCASQNAFTILQKQMQQAQQEKANIVKGMTQMQAQIERLLNNDSSSNEL